MNIVYCLSGNNFSGTFLDCFANLIEFNHKMGWKYYISRKYSCNIYYSRNMCLGADVLRGKNQKPFNGKLKYDYLFWIDNDIVFDPEQVKILINHNQDIISGLYLMENETQFATVKNWDNDKFKKEGHFDFLTNNDLKVMPRIFSVSYTGFGFIAIKYGVFENMKYPFFEPIYYDLGDNIVDFSMEDVSFCQKAIKNGYKIQIDKNIIVGHEKKKIII